MGIFETCYAIHDENLSNVMHCVANWVEEEVVAHNELNKINENSDVVQNIVQDFNNWMLIMAGSLVFFMQAGFATLCAGAVRRKNVNNTLLKNLLDACGAAVAFYAIGYGIALGGSGNKGAFSGNSGFFLSEDVDPAVFFFQFAFSATAGTIVAGTLAERCTMVAYFAYSLVLTGIVYPVVAHFVWNANGYLSTGLENPILGVGMVDFAGSGVVHMTGGATALYASYILGPRRGRFFDSDGNPLRRPGLQKGHSPALQMLGTLILWFGWYGFNPGSALLLGVDNRGEVAAIAAVNTTLAAAVGAISALATNAYYHKYRGGEFDLDVGMAMNGCLSGLVGITAGCAVVDQWAAVVIGLVAGWLYFLTTGALKMVKIDDAVDAIPVHFFNGVWGVVSVGLFAQPSLLLSAYGVSEHAGWFYNPADFRLLGAQLMGVVFIVGWTFTCMYPFFLFLDRLSLFRVHEMDEFIGLDAKYDDNGNNGIFDDTSSNDEELRLEAYKKRYNERKMMRQSKHGSKLSLDDVMNTSWGGDEFASVGGKFTEMSGNVSDLSENEGRDKVQGNRKHLKFFQDEPDEPEVYL